LNAPQSFADELVPLGQRSREWFAEPSRHLLDLERRMTVSIGERLGVPTFDEHAERSPTIRAEQALASFREPHGHNLKEPRKPLAA
jgi:hypothetical protein